MQAEGRGSSGKAWLGALGWRGNVVTLSRTGTGSHRRCLRERVTEETYFGEITEAPVSEDRWG